MILVTCCLSLFLVTMDVTIVNVALPAIGRDLGASLGGLQWAIDGYTVVLASFLVLGGSIADRFGRRRVFQLGLATFTAGSLLCSAAPTIEALVACRVVQALGGTMLNPVAMSILVNTYTDPRRRARAIGVWAGVHGIAMAIGPLVGGALVQAVGWRAIFWVNAPVAVAAIALTRRFVPESRAEQPRRADPIGQALLAIGLATLTSVLIAARGGWSARSALGLAIAGGALIALIAYERGRREPLLDPRCFRSAPFSAAIGIAVIAFAMFNGGLFLASLHLQGARGLSALHAGLCFAPIAVALIICSPLSGRLVGAGHARHALLGAGGALAVGALIVQSPALAGELAGLALFGVALGLANTPITHAAVSGLPRAQAGVAAGLAATSRQVGATLGVAIAGAAEHSFWWLALAGGAAIVALGFLEAS